MWCVSSNVLLLCTFMSAHSSAVIAYETNNNAEASLGAVNLIDKADLWKVTKRN